MLEAIKKLIAVRDRIAALAVPTTAIPISTRRNTIQSGNYRISNIYGNPIFWEYRNSDYEGWKDYRHRDYLNNRRMCGQPKIAWIAIPSERLSSQQWQIAQELIKSNFKKQPEKALVVGIRLLRLTAPKRSDELVDAKLSLNLDYLYLKPCLTKTEWQELVNWARFLGLDSRVKVWTWETDPNRKLQIIALKKAG